MVAWKFQHANHFYYTEYQKFILQIKYFPNNMLEKEKEILILIIF
jgi:hypothetical protein